MKGTVKKAEIKYIPDQCYINDVISIFHDKVILTKSNFIYPDFNWEWEYPKYIYYEETNKIIITPHSHCTSLYFEYICIKDNQDNILFEEKDYTFEDETIELNYIITNLKTEEDKIQFFLNYIINSTEFSEKSNEIPIKWRSSYDLTILDPPLVSGVENRLKLSAINSEIETGSILTFKSLFGLYTQAELKEPNYKPPDKETVISYTPNESDMTDTVTVYYNNELLISKDFYINPYMAFEWFLPECLYIDQTNKIFFKYIGTKHSSLSPIVVDTFKVVSSENVIMYTSDNYELGTDAIVKLEYTPVGEVDETVSFKIEYSFKGIDYSFVSNEISIKVGNIKC